LASLKEKESILKKKKERLSRLNDLLVNQIKELKDQIQASMKLQHESALQTKGGTQGMAMLMIDNELQQNRTRLGALEERLYVDLENQYSELNKEINDNARDQVRQVALIDEKEKNLDKFKLENEMDIEKQKSEIARLEAERVQIPAQNEQKIETLKQNIADLNNQLANLIDTRAITEPIRSQQPTGTSKKLIVVLGGVLAIIFGLFATFIAEFLKKVKASQSEYTQT
jgi:hypothetical protein